MVHDGSRQSVGGDPEAHPEICAHGLRNPWRFDVDHETGDVWIGDVGQYCTEEISVIRGGAADASPNLGWPSYEATRPFLVDEFGDIDQHHEPILTLPHERVACSVVGGVVYRGAAFPEAKGAFVFTDSCDDVLRFVHADGDAVTVDEASLPISQVVAIDVDVDGELLLSSLVDGIHRVVPAAP